MENGTLSQGEGKDPSSFLGEIIGSPVTVKLNSGVVYKGLRSPFSLRQKRPKDSHKGMLIDFKQANFRVWMVT